MRVHSEEFKAVMLEATESAITVYMLAPKDAHLLLELCRTDGSVTKAFFGEFGISTEELNDYVGYLRCLDGEQFPSIQQSCRRAEVFAWARPGSPEPDERDILRVSLEHLDGFLTSLAVERRQEQDFAAYIARLFA